MKNLIKMYKGLPREVKTIVAIAGVSTPAGMIYALKRWVFPSTPFWLVILYVLGFVAVVCILAWLLGKVFGRGKKKRQDRMANELAGDAAGSKTSMDVAAAIKDNNEKFFRAVNDMRKNIGLSVYDLPWYIVIGDSGCGKTKLINEGGLQFSTGKPEGYQLGTLNYNWWFSEDAVFIDMAGRLCNPRDDADRREWEAFLGTVGRGRRGYPINGAVVCVSADHLLQDPPEKIEQDANTTLERLRDLQTRLGVTFATYLVITKCDKIVGFMQFFDRAERDIRVLNQMVGWSKPGEFNELYDPEEFPDDFNDVYTRLYDLRLRRLNDDAEEIDLGLAYCFPEEFRELRDPLHTYIRTLFPKIKNPRAIKNLLYRGVYFTSATREGGLILKHLTERLGPEAAEQFQPLDLYPSKRPYFIRDFFFRKMFPEHGLVFRNEQEAVRSRKLANLLKYGGVAMALILFTLVGIGAKKFSDAISQPRMTAWETEADKPPEVPNEALERTVKLATHAENLTDNPWAAVLTLGLATNKPVYDLQTIHAGLFERILLPRALNDVGKALRESELPPPGTGNSKQAETYLAALREYVRWYGCREATAWPTQLKNESLKSMTAVVSGAVTPESVVLSMGEEFSKQAGLYFETTEENDWRSPSRYLVNDQPGWVNPEETIATALENVRDYYGVYASLDSGNPDAIVREWMRLREACKALSDSYDTMLTGSEGEFSTLEAMSAYRTSYLENCDVFTTRLSDIKWDPELPIESLRDAILMQREKSWLAYRQTLSEALNACGTGSNEAVARLIETISESDGGLRITGLDEILWNNLYEAGLTKVAYNPDYFKDRDEFMKRVYELYSPYSYIVSFNEEAKTDRNRLEIHPDTFVVRDALVDVRRVLENAVIGAGEGTGTLDAWKTTFESFGGGTGTGLTPSAKLKQLANEWQPKRLDDLYNTIEDRLGRGRFTALLASMKAGLSATGTWGVAELYDNAFDGRPSHFSIPTSRPTRPVRRPDTQQETQEDEQDDQGDEALQGRFQRRSRRTPEPTPPSESKPAVQEEVRVDTGESERPLCSDGSFLRKRMDRASVLLDYLSQVVDKDYFQPEGESRLPDTCKQLLRDSVRRYVNSYVSAWSTAYGGFQLRSLDAIESRANDWRSLSQALGGPNGQAYLDVTAEFSPSLEQLLESLSFALCFNTDGRYDCNAFAGYPEWDVLSRYFTDALSSEWKNDGAYRFLTQARPGNGPLAPWTSAARDMTDAWNNLARSLLDFQEFPRDFGQRQSGASASVAWGELQRTRERLGLADEKITGRLADFEMRAQRLLSNAITDALVQLQDQLGRGTSVGWPYLSTSDGGIYSTLDFVAFKRFLLEVAHARAYFAPLEQNLPSDDPGVVARRRFYDDCDAWFSFIGMQDSSDLPHKPLPVNSVAYFDPKNPREPQVGRLPQDTAQLLYGVAKIDLGLSVQGEGRMPLEIETEAGSRTKDTWQAVWDWNATGAMTFRLEEGRSDKAGGTLTPVERVIGNCSPLSFCAYLESRAKPQGGRQDWATVEIIDLPGALSAAGKGNQAASIRSQGYSTVGVGFRFNLARAMPQPIAALRR